MFEVIIVSIGIAVVSSVGIAALTILGMILNDMNKMKKGLQ